MTCESADLSHSDKTLQSLNKTEVIVFFVWLTWSVWNRNKLEQVYPLGVRMWQPSGNVNVCSSMVSRKGQRSVEFLVVADLGWWNLFLLYGFQHVASQYVQMSNTRLRKHFMWPNMWNSLKLFVCLFSALRQREVTDSGNFFVVSLCCLVVQCLFVVGLSLFVADFCLFVVSLCIFGVFRVSFVSLHSSFICLLVVLSLSWNSFFRIVNLMEVWPVDVGLTHLGPEMWKDP